MKIVIVGAGAIGMLTGAYLARGGNEVFLWKKIKKPLMLLTSMV